MKTEKQLKEIAGKAPYLKSLIIDVKDNYCFRKVAMKTDGTLFVKLNGQDRRVKQDLDIVNAYNLI